MDRIGSTHEALEKVKNTTTKGGDYWMARDIQAILGYSTWENFAAVVERAMQACAASGEESHKHFREATKMIEIGNNTQRPVLDYYLDRYACYLGGPC